MSHDVSPGLAQPQIAEQHGLEEGWEVRIPKSYLILRGIELQSERRLQHEKRRAARPGLR